MIFKGISIWAFTKYKTKNFPCYMPAWIGADGFRSVLIWRWFWHLHEAVNAFGNCKINAVIQTCSYTEDHLFACHFFWQPASTKAFRVQLGFTGQHQFLTPYVGTNKRWMWAFNTVAPLGRWTSSSVASRSMPKASGMCASSLFKHASMCC